MIGNALLEVIYIKYIYKLYQTNKSRKSVEKGCYIYFHFKNK